MADAERERAVRAMRGMSAVREAGKRERGEIFTPAELAEEMLDSVPAPVWADPGARVLDPAAGFGVFPVLAFFRFMRGLRRKIPDEAARRRHIVGSVLHAVELDAGNAAACRRLLRGLGGGADPNVHRGDFLAWGGGGGGFDLVMGNPPYNAPGLNIGGALWVRFVRRSGALLGPRGRLLMVHPPGWRKPVGEARSAGDIWKAFRTGGRLLRLHVEGRRRPPFPEVDWYLWRKGGRPGGRTVVTSGGGGDGRAELALADLPFLPGLLTDASLGLLRKVLAGPGDETYRFVRDNRFRHRAAEARGPVPHAHYWDDALGDYRTLGLSEAQVAAMTRAGGGPGFYAASKVVMTLNGPRAPGALHPRHYPEGERMGVTTSVMYQEMPREEARACVRFFSSDLVRCVLTMCQYSSAPHRKNEPGVVNALRRPPRGACRTGASLAAHFRLTAREAALVREVVEKGRRAGGGLQSPLP